MLAVTFNEVMVTLHVLAIVVAFGGAVTYPLWFAMVRRGTAEQRAFFHRAQARLGMLVIVPGMVVLFATGAYLASDFDVWSEGWVIVPLVLLVVIAALGIGFLGPSEDRLSTFAAEGRGEEYEALFRRVRAVTIGLIVLVVAATFLMVAHIPD